MKRRAEPDYSDSGSPVSGPFILDDLPGGDPAYPKERSHEEEEMTDDPPGWDVYPDPDDGGYTARDWAFNLLLIYSVAVSLALAWSVVR